MMVEKPGFSNGSKTISNGNSHPAWGANRLFFYKLLEELSFKPSAKVAKSIAIGLASIALATSPKPAASQVYQDAKSDSAKTEQIIPPMLYPSNPPLISPSSPPTLSPSKLAPTVNLQRPKKPGRITATPKIGSDTLEFKGDFGTSKISLHGFLEKMGFSSFPPGSFALDCSAEEFVSFYVFVPGTEYFFQLSAPLSNFMDPKAPTIRWNTDIVTLPYKYSLDNIYYKYLPNGYTALYLDGILALIEAKGSDGIGVSRALAKAGIYKDNMKLGKDYQLEINYKEESKTVYFNFFLNSKLVVYFAVTFTGPERGQLSIVYPDESGISK